MKRILFIVLILPLLTLAQERNHGGGGNFKGFGKDNSKDYIKGNISGKIIELRNIRVIFTFGIKINIIQNGKIPKFTHI